ncbi:DUF397 domain-containing protein [Streptomyces sp. NPDC012600]|uniref:DUF397 domain-containing protein n=1 Tax=Streptomyces stephensoniae TaxID=3375367 RepID=A0ABU2W4M0_9ACTN|nr:DUF397 domain-containing protein [Streptomyces griseus]MDT0492271.1 DUF397 domain-containing protein [Streptomyces griseus]MDT0527137.1 DUF397 domain-containing protein [Streptomyces sp. DSM 41633]
MVRYGLPDDAWVKSSYSPDSGGNCIETQATPDGLVAVGDSKDRALGAHTFAPAPWQTFVTAVRDGAL